MKAYGEVKVQLFSLKLGCRWKCMFSFRLRPLLSLREGKRCTLKRKMRGPEIHSGAFGEKIKCLPLMGIEPIFFGRSGA
jgi:hypothetical protein